MDCCIIQCQPYFYNPVIPVGQRIGIIEIVFSYQVSQFPDFGGIGLVKPFCTDSCFLPYFNPYQVGFINFGYDIELG